MKSRLYFVTNSSSFIFGIPNENTITIDGVYDRLPNDIISVNQIVMVEFLD